MEKWQSIYKIMGTPLLMVFSFLLIGKVFNLGVIGGLGWPYVLIPLVLALNLLFLVFPLLILIELIKQDRAITEEYKKHFKNK